MGTLQRRGRSYNGYPVSRGYYGAYSMDGLAMALYCIYNTSSFAAAVERVVNFLGDADSTGAIVGQIAGAIYGFESIPENLLAALKKWDNESVTLRAMMLYKAGCLSPKERAVQRSFNNAHYSPRTKEDFAVEVRGDTKAMLYQKIQEGNPQYILDYFQAKKTAMEGQDAVLQAELKDLSLEQIKARTEYEVAFELVQQLMQMQQRP